MTPRIRIPIALTLAMLMMAACNTEGTTTVKPTGKASTPPPRKLLTPSPTPTPRKSTGAELPGGDGSPTPPPPSLAPVATPTPAGLPTANPNDPITPPGVPLTDRTKLLAVGKVFDLDGKQRSQGINVIFRNKDGAERKFNCEDGPGGAYQTDDLPEGIYAVTATGYGFTPRTRFVKLLKGSTYTVNFGEVGKDDQCYALSEFPEVTSVDVGAKVTEVDGTRIQMTIKLSKPMQQKELDEFQSLLRLLPLNEVANAGAAPPDLNSGGAATATIDKFAYGIDFPVTRPPLQPPSWYGQPLNASWSEFQTLTITWNSPLLNGQAPAKYQLALLSDPDQRVTDISDAKNQLGMDETGNQKTWPAKDHFVNKVFVDPNLGPATFIGDTTEHKWSSTHVNAFQFTLKPDLTAPAPIGVGAEITLSSPVAPAVPDELETVFFITFDESLAARGPGGAAIAKSATDLLNYTFSVGQSTTYLSGAEHLDGVSRLIDIKSDSTAFGTDTGVLGKEFHIVSVAGHEAAIRLRPNDSHTAELIIKNPDLLLHNKFDPTKNDLVVAVVGRVANVQDPAGNAIPAAKADKKDAQKFSNITYHQIAP
ncbi:MAG: hypothetical protein JWM80_2633 [Cyanobacteria bacterium RYN_339]|nr:hypothetical protein [Cyanobacteria bacterium RYN_339]